MKKKEQKVEGYLEVGRNYNNEIVINIPAIKGGREHLVFSPEQAKNLARLLYKHARESEKDKWVIDENK